MNSLTKLQPPITKGKLNNAKKWKKFPQRCHKYLYGDTAFMYSTMTLYAD